MTGSTAKPVTKQQFLRALACPTMAYLDRQRPAGPLDNGAKWLVYVGNRVGDLAREALGPGRMLPPPFSAVALSESAAAIAKGMEVLFEATMEAGGMLARADALVPGPGGWELIEVKSGKMPDDGKPKAAYVDDLAYTLCVARLAGVPVVRATLMLLSRDYTDGSAEPLFGSLDVTAEAGLRADEMGLGAHEIVAAVTGPNQPVAALRLACKSCEHFKTACIGIDVEDSLLRIPRITDKKLAELSPCVSIGMLPKSAKFTDTQQKVVDVIKRRGVSRDEKALQALHHVRWPAFYLDFEAVSPALSWFPGDAAYTTMPNQYSVHVCSSSGEIADHRDFLADFDSDWRQVLAERLLKDLDGEGSIVVYSSYEKTQLSALARLFPEMSARIQQVIERLFDLEPFFKNAYIDHRFAGTSSIKAVLPVLVPELSYDQMAVGGGSVAAGIFCLMREGVIPPAEYASHRQNLLDYCKLDTLAMVRLHEALLKL